MRLYTIGHSNIDADDFVCLLKKEGIEVLVDVRSHPYSKYASQFNKENIMKVLMANGIKYVFMGNTLGGRPNDKGCYIDGNPDYDLIRQKDFYQKGIKRLIEGIARYRIVIMCSEEDPMKCHRRNLIARDLHKNGFEILHIRGSGAIESDAFCVEDKEVLQKSLF
ncbi:MAG: DUF488 domain-containing protein [Thermodesulfovibrionia bacterium]